MKEYTQMIKKQDNENTAIVPKADAKGEASDATGTMRISEA
jgi:hypothetical protein